MEIKSENHYKTNQTVLIELHKTSNPQKGYSISIPELLNSYTKQNFSSSSCLNSTTQLRNFIKRFVLACLFLASPLLSSSQCDNQGKGGQIKIITWNIYMLPHLFIHTGQAERAKEIAEVLKTQDADIIVFEEAFDNKARNIIRDSLKAYFPYESGDPGKNTWWKTSCGVWIISKVPIEVMKQIYFKEANGSDRLATKGAILVEGQKDGFCFQLVGTHLQSDLNCGKNVQPIRDKQYAEIKKQLLEPYSQENIPQFLAGDFNTIHDDSCCYNHMVGTIKFNQCQLDGDKCYSYDYTHNDLVIGTNNKPQLIDYLMYAPTPQQQISGSMQIVVFKKKWDIKHCDLSDHFAVAGTFNYTDGMTTTAFAGTK